MGIVSAAGSLGALLSAPIGQLLNEGYGWRTGMIGFVLLALFMLPAAWYAGRVDKVPLPPKGADDIADTSAAVAVKIAFGNASFAVMTLAYFVCGMQLVFLTTHLPSYLAICGMDPMLSAQTLGMIGGFNVLGSLFFGWAGGRWNKLVLLGMIYVLRSLVLAGFIIITIIGPHRSLDCANGCHPRAIRSTERLACSFMVQTNQLLMTVVTVSGHIQNPRLRVGGPTTQVILCWRAGTHDNNVRPMNLYLNRVQRANNPWQSRVINLNVHLVRQGRVQHTQTRLGNAPLLIWCAPVADRSCRGARSDNRRKESGEQQRLK